MTRTTFKRLLSPLRRRLSAFLGATVIVLVLWLVAVLSVNVFASSPRLADRDRRFVIGVERLLPAASLHKNGPAVVFLHNSGANPIDLTAWHTVVQILILITLAALVVSGLDRLRRENRRRRRPRNLRLRASRIGARGDELERDRAHHNHSDALG
jgi:hypothetical protein